MDFTKLDISVNNLVRSAAIAAVGLPLALGTSGFLNATTEALQTASAESAQVAEYESLRSKLTTPCLEYLFSKADSKLERSAKNAIDDTFGGEVDYKGVCGWIIQ